MNFKLHSGLLLLAVLVVPSLAANARTESTPATPSSEEVGPASPWKRGYDQAMSGTRYVVTLLSEGKAVQPKNKGCTEYRDGSDERARCMKGFVQGAREYGDKLLALDWGSTDGATAAELGCLDSFRAGKLLATRDCANIKEGGCTLESISPKDPFVGCASYGWAAQILRCDEYLGSRSELRRSLGEGALTQRELAPTRDRHLYGELPGRTLSGKALPGGEPQAE